MNSNRLKYNSKFEPLFKTPENVRYYIVTGGRFSSKSYSVSTAVCTKVNNENRKALYTRYTLTSAKDSIIPEYIEKLDLLKIADYYYSTNDRVIGAEKREVVFKGIKTSSGNQTAKLKSLKGFSIFVLDEAEEENDEEAFDKINFSIRESAQNLVILVLNPSVKEHWIYKRFFESTGIEPGSNKVVDNVCYIHTDYRDVIKHVPKDYLHELDLLKLSNPIKFNHIILGGWLDAAEGVIFSNWKYGEFDNSLPFGYGMDFGFFPDPDVLIRVAVDRKRKKIYVKQELKLNSTGVDDLALNIKISCDTNKTIYADSSEPRLISDLKSRGVSGIISVKKWAGSVLEGIKLMQGYEIIVDNSSTDIAKELNNYVWSSKRKDTPVDAYNHNIDAIRYYVQSVVKPYVRKGMKAL